MTLSGITRPQLDQTVQASGAKSLVASQPPARSGLGLPSLISPTQRARTPANPYTVLSDDTLGPGDDLQCFEREFASDCTSVFEVLRRGRRAKQLGHQPPNLDITLRLGRPFSPTSSPSNTRTIILRPRQQLSLRELTIPEVCQTITANIPQDLVCSTAEYDIRVLRRSNAVAVDTQNDSFIQALMAISPLPLKNQRYTVQPHEAIQRGQIRGVIHGTPGYTVQQLQVHLTCPTACIITARPIGTSSSTLITFEGPHLPKKVRLQHIVMPVFPYTPKMRVSCCHAFSHNVNLCPNPKEARCSKCGQAGHPPDRCDVCDATQPKCMNCEGAHLATDPTYPSRLKANAAAYRRLQQYAKNLRKPTKPAKETYLRRNQWGRDDQPTPHGEEFAPRKDLREWKQGLKQELKRELVKDITTIVY